MREKRWNGEPLGNRRFEAIVERIENDSHNEGRTRGARGDLTTAPTIRRVLIGAPIGFVSGGVCWLGATSGGADIGSAAGFLVGGAGVGAAYAGLFCPRPGGHAEHAMSGLVIALTAWVVLPMNVYPTLSGAGPMWGAGAAGELFAVLVGYLLFGVVTAVAYGAVHVAFPERLGLVEPDDGPAPSIETRIVILGGGYAGVAAAQQLERELAGDPEVGVWLINDTNYMLHTPLLSEVSSSSVSPQHIVPPLRSFFGKVRVVEGGVDRIDREERVVHLVSGGRGGRSTLAYDHLALSVGSVPSFFGNREIEERAFTFKSLEDAVALRSRVISMFERADLETDAEARRRHLTFVVAGGGFAGVELVGALNDFARGIRPYYPDVGPDDVRLVLVHASDRILPELSESLAEYAREKLEQRGVEFELGAKVTGVGGGSVRVDGREAIATETLVWTAGNRPHPVLETLGLPLTDRGQVETNTELQVDGAPGVWAAGDCARVPDLAAGGFVPPTAQHAVRQGKTLGRNVAASLKGKPLETFRFRTLGSLAALGHQLAVAEVFGHRFSGLAAWLLWRAIYLSKLPTFEKRVRVGIDWGLDIFFPPDIVRAAPTETREKTP